MEHTPGTQPAMKLDGGPGFSGNCSCGWVSQGYEVGQGAERRALKSALAHADSKITTLIQEAANAGHSPEMVIAAVRAVNAGRDYDLAAVAWEFGTTAIAIFQGEGGTAAVRYTMAADLLTPLKVERVRVR